MLCRYRILRPNRTQLIPVGQPTPRFFATPEELRDWFRQHHRTADALWVGFYKKGSGEASITWPESVDEALCYGWIDGIRKGIDKKRYTIRFTPRKAGSNWSKRNIERVEELTAKRRMRAAGKAAYERRHEGTHVGYSYEDVYASKLTPAQTRRLQSNEKAWAFFQEQAPWYRRGAVHWVTSAKREETRERRLTTLIECSAAGNTVPPLTRE